MIWMPGQSISFVEGARFMNDDEVISGEEEGPSCLAAEKVLFCAEVSKIVVVCPNLEWCWVSL